MTLEVEFLEAINGVSKTIQFPRLNKCSTCEGTKRKPGTHELKCEVCGGIGYHS